MERLLPDPGPTTIDAEVLERFDPRAESGRERPYVYSNFAVTVDGRAALGGRSGQIGSAADTEFLMALREGADAVLIGGGTVRAEEYGRLLPGAKRRQRRVDRGRAPDPLAVVVTASLDLPWGAGIFADGAGKVVIVTSNTDDPPATETPVELIRQPDGIDLGAALAQLRHGHGVSALLCEGGPKLLGRLVDAELLDEVFVTQGALLGGGDGPAMVEGAGERARGLELVTLLREGDELFARYRVQR